MPSPPIIVPDGFSIIAHRGASGHAPENTIAAFRLAREMGATEIETDAQLTTDGAVVLCHDETLERYGHGPRVIEEMTSAELLALDMGSWFAPRFAGERIATLRSLFETFRDAFVYHVEIKGKREGLEREVARIIDESHLRERSVITSFRHDALARMRSADPALRLGWLVERIDAQTCKRAKELGLFQLCPNAKDVTREGVAAAHKVVQEVRAWGLSGSPERVRELIARVVDAGCDGMTINWPDWAKHESK